MNAKQSTPKHVLITGATGGIGRALAIAYAQPGIRLSLLGRQQAILDELAKRCHLQGADIVTYSLDLLNIDELIKTIETIDNEKPVDLVVANAGVATYLDATTREESWQDSSELVTINLIAAMATVSPLITRMRARKQGKIVFMSSLAAYRGLAINPSYSASKAGVKAYAEALRALLREDNVQVSVICPGFIESNMSKKFPGKRPFLLSAENATKKIQKGIEKNKAYITFPYLLVLGMKLLTLLPSRLADLILQILGYGNPKKV